MFCFKLKYQSDCRNKEKFCYQRGTLKRHEGKIMLSSSMTWNSLLNITLKGDSVTKTIVKFLLVRIPWGFYQHENFEEKDNRMCSK